MPSAFRCSWRCRPVRMRGGGCQARDGCTRFDPSSDRCRGGIDSRRKLRALRTLWQESDFDRVFRAFSSDGSTDVRKEAAWTLQSNASPATWRRLFEVWRADSLPRHRGWACDLASAYGDSDVLADLRGLVNDIDGHVRERATRTVRDLETGGVSEGL